MDEKKTPGLPTARLRAAGTLRRVGQDAAGQVHGIGGRAPHAGHGTSGCPGSAAREITRSAPAGPAAAGTTSDASELSQWPIQLHLVSPHAPYFNNSDLLVAADCTAFSLGGFHRDLLRGKKLVIACPKLDDTAGYVEKLAEILKANTVYSLTAAIMTVPCCSGLARMVDEAVELSGARVNVKKVVINIDGSLQQKSA